MTSNVSEVYQFHIVLKEFTPLIWRRIQVPAFYSFWDLHVAIQDAMGWQDEHLHEFSVLDPITGMDEEMGLPDPEVDDAYNVLASWNEMIADYFIKRKTTALYLYDFGDNWEHEITFEGVFSATGKNYPVCLDGEMKCPPEDSGGVWGYQEKLQIFQDPTHEEYEFILEWMGDDFDPTEFQPKQVIFDDPAERKRRLGSFGF